MIIFGFGRHLHFTTLQRLCFFPTFTKYIVCTQNPLRVFNRNIYLMVLWVQKVVWKCCLYVWWCRCCCFRCADTWLTQNLSSRFCKNFHKAHIIGHYKVKSNFERFKNQLTLIKISLFSKYLLYFFNWAVGPWAQGAIH